MASLRLDRRTGQTYLEREMVPLPPNGPSWVHETPYLPEGWESTSRVGAPTLKHAAMKQTLSNQRNLVPELFANVPWPIASYLWDCLGRSRKRTLYIWKVFAVAYPKEFASVAHYRSMKIGNMRLPVQDYLSMAKSEGLHWRVVLSLGATFVTVTELVDIANLPNLVALEICSSPGSISGPRDPSNPDLEVAGLEDRIVRTWSELAQSKGAFAHLRVLRLSYQKCLTKRVLDYLAQLPALEFLITSECDRISCHARRDMHDWEVSASTALKTKELYECYQNSLAGDVSGKPTTIDCERPVLDFQIGNGTDQMPFKLASHREEMLLLRRVKTEAGPATKRLKRTKPLDEAFQKPAGPRKPVMKDRRVKDLSETLGDFL